MMLPATGKSTLLKNALRMVAAGLMELVPAPAPLLAQEAPSMEQARSYLFQHSDVACDKRQLANLIKDDRAVLLSAAGAMSTRLYDLYCDNSGAQATRVFLVWTSSENRLTLLHFARPVYAMRYKDEAVSVGLAEPVRVVGFDTLSAVPAARYDSETHTLHSDVHWGKQADGGEFAQWRWNHATRRFDLVSYVIDPHLESELEPALRKAWVGKVIRLFPF